MPRPILIAALSVAAALGSPVLAGTDISSSRAEAIRRAFVALAGASKDRSDRSTVRLAYARALVEGGRGAEALGVLAVIRRDTRHPQASAELSALSARAALLARRPQAALEAALANPSQQTDCVTVVRASAMLRQAGTGRPYVDCALRQAARMPTFDRERVARAAALILLDYGEPKRSLTLLEGLRTSPFNDALISGMALARMGDVAGALRRWEIAGASTHGATAQYAAALRVDLQRRTGRIDGQTAWTRLEKDRLRWRGGVSERTLLRAQLDAAMAAGQPVYVLRAAATLSRYFDLGAEGPVIIAAARESMGTVVAGTVPLRPAQIASVFWSFRDLAPEGEEGDRIVRRLAERLAASGAAELGARMVIHQATRRADVAARPVLGAEAARLYLLADRPKEALAALEATQEGTVPADVTRRRRQLRIAAYIASGNPNAASALLDAFGDVDPMFGAEASWILKRYDKMATLAEQVLQTATLDRKTALDISLRQLVALQSIGREAEARSLAARLVPIAGSERNAQLVRVLASDPELITPADLEEALASLPAGHTSGLSELAMR